MTDVHQTYCGDQFMTHVCQVIMLCTLNLYSAVRELYLNKIRRIKKVNPATWQSFQGPKLEQCEKENKSSRVGL